MTETTRHEAPDVADLRRRLLDAGGGPKPWSVPEHDTSSVNDADGWCVASCSYGTSGGDHDAALIAAAVNALPALLDAAAERDALSATVERVRALPVGPSSGGYYMVSMRDVRAALDGEAERDFDNGAATEMRAAIAAAKEATKGRETR